MCGVAGIRTFRGSVSETELKSMCETLKHRGPDDQGTYINPSQKVGLAQQRLSIIDLSMAGHQPMEREGLYVTYNGEIYNFAEIKKELESLGAKFSSHSDTEVLLLAYKRWGKEAVQKFRGMFAFAIWNAETEELVLCRDRAGVKPLYYYHDDSLFLFASEAKAIMAHPSAKRDVDYDALASFFRFGYVPSPQSIWKNVHKLEPGHFLTVAKDGTLSKERYWNIRDHVAPQASALDEKSILAETESILSEAFKLRMVADVPVGVFLSGGIDSSLLTALLSKDADRPLETFTIGFDEDGYDEAPFAREIAKHLGTNHHELYVTPKRAQELIRKIPDLYDEPFGDFSAIPTFLVSEFARSNVKVALSADGGDELFCGYGNKYPGVEETYRKYAALPRIAGGAARLLSKTSEDARRIQLLAAQNNIAATYAVLQKKSFSDAEVLRLLKGKADPKFSSVHWNHFEGMEHADLITQLGMFDFETHMTDDILAKVDRASMAVGLESREPFLDQRIVEHAVSLPTALKRKNGQDKYLLKQILYSYVPQSLVDRPKQGFGMPISEWLKRDLSSLLDEYLDESRIRKEGFLDPASVSKEKKAFLEGRTYGRGLVRLLAFQMWKERWLGA